MSTEFINDQWRLPNAWNGSESNVNKQSNYSMDFDGSQWVNLGDDDIFSFGDSTNDSPFSISAWIYMDSTTNFRILAKYDAPNYEYQFDVGGSSNLRFYIFDGSSYRARIGSTLSINQWYHVVATYNGVGGTNAENGIKIYVDGVEITGTTSSNGSYTAMHNTTAPVYIGRIASSYANGKIDGVAIYNYALSSSQITTLYGSSSTGIGNPMSLSPKPVAYYPLGDQDAFNGSSYLTPNSSLKDFVFDFDGSNDYIDCGTSSSIEINGNITISAWIFVTTGSSFQGIVAKRGTTTNYQFYTDNSAIPKLRFWDGAGVSSTETLSLNTWHHAAVTVNSGVTNGLTFYIDGVPSGTETATIVSNSDNLTIGSIGSGNVLNGKLSNVSIWNTNLTSAQISEIYNQGVPSNLNNHSAYSNLVSWWQLGSNSSFNTNWTVLDEKGSNNGTSTNMGEDAIVDGVNTYGGGTSSGMGGDEVIGDAPYSTANALSVNMDVEDRVTDTPS